MLALIKKKQLPGTPMALATAPVHDPHLTALMANEVAARADHPRGREAARLSPSGAGSRSSAGSSGMGTDAYATWQIGRYVDREFLPRNRR